MRPRPIKDSQGELQWEVEKILEEKIMEDGTYMWVKWTGFDSDECTWEPEADLPVAVVDVWRTRISMSNREELVGSSVSSNKVCYSYTKFNTCVGPHCVTDPLWRLDSSTESDRLL